MLELLYTSIILVLIVRALCNVLQLQTQIRKPKEKDSGTERERERERCFTSPEYLNSLCCLAIQHELVSSIYFNDVTSDLALKKARKAKLE
jgi:hypothetical protein